MNAPLKPRRKPVNLSLDPRLVDEARAAGVNLSRAAEEGVRRAMAEAWLRDNAEAIEKRKAWIEQNGTALAKWQVWSPEDGPDGVGQTRG